MGPKVYLADVQALLLLFLLFLILLSPWQAPHGPSLDHCRSLSLPWWSGTLHSERKESARRRENPMTTACPLIDTKWLLSHRIEMQKLDA